MLGDRRASTLRHRLIAGGIAVGLVLALIPVTAANADENQLILPGGGASVALGPNAVLRVDGRLQYVTECSEGGIGDFVYPASDVYIVEGDPSAGAAIDVPLEDVTGTPSTIVQGGSAFVEQIIAITGPTGMLGPGTYSIVFDTCQDGKYQRREGDTVFPNAITVTYPAVIPAEDPLIAAIKTDARTDWGTWQDIGRLFDSLIEVEDIASCATGTPKKCVGLIQIWAGTPTTAAWLGNIGLARRAAECLGGDTATAAGACFGLISGKVSNVFGGSIRDRVLGGAKSLIANRAKSAYGLYADPPRADFGEATSAVLDYPVEATVGGGAYLDGMSAFAAGLEREVALEVALVAALERYQGARGAGDPVAAAARARDAAGIASALAGARERTAVLTRAVFDGVAALVPDLDATTDQLLGDIARRGGSGFTPAEDRALRGAGIAGADRAALLDAQRADARGVFPVLMNLGPVARLEADAAGSAARLRTAASDLASLADRIVADGAGSAAADALAEVPVVTVSAPSPAVVGTAKSLSATAAPGATLAWYLDADGAFDDGTGATATATWVVPGDRVVAVKATTAAATVTAHALIRVTSADAPPVISAAAPVDGTGAPIANGTVGGQSVFEVTATDPEGQPLAYEWTIDGEVVPGATGATLTLTPSAAERGERVVAVTVRDGQPANLAQTAWKWVVADRDADGDGWADNAVSDCDDANPAVNPGRAEVLYNGQDDDCSAATPDEPLGLGSGGEVWTWGQWIASQRGDRPEPGKLSGLEGIVQLASGDRKGYALTSTGAVYGWGGDDGFVAGIGTNRAPTPVFGVGSASGQLTGVVSLTDADPSAYALLSDGRVVSWGFENNGTLGAGTGLYARGYPDYVLGPDTTGDGTPDPLGDVAEVWQLGEAGLARTADGTVYQWGARQCADAGWGVRPAANVAVAEPGLTAALATMVQATGSGNNPGSAIFRLADGSVLACGAEREVPYMYTFNRIQPFGPFGPDNPAVDVASNGNEWWVVTADGGVWVKTWDTTTLTMPGCTPETCPAGQLIRLPLPADWFAVDVAAGGDIQFRLADGRLVTYSGENTFQSVGHPTPDNPTPSNIPGAVDIAGYVMQSETLVWNGFALVLPDAAIADAGWTPPRPQVRVSAVGATGPEGGTATASVALSAATDVPVEVTWRFGEDSGAATVPAGATTADVELALPAADGVWGADRAQTFELTGAAGVTLGDENAPVTITDVDAPPAVSISPDALPEGDASPSGRTATISLSRAAAIDVALTVSSQDGTAVAGEDFSPVDLDVLIPAGQTAATIPVVLLGDTLPDPERRFALRAEPSTPGLSAATQEVRIDDDDPVVLRTSGSRVAGGGVATVIVTATRIPAGETVRVEYVTADLSAKAGTDYVAADGVLTLTGGDDGSAEAGIAIATLPASAAALGRLGTAAAPVSSDQLLLTVQLAASSSSEGRTVIVPSDVPVGILREGVDTEPPGPGGPGDPGDPGTGAPGPGAPGPGGGIASTGSDPGPVATLAALLLAAGLVGIGVARARARRGAPPSER